MRCYGVPRLILTGSRETEVGVAYRSDLCVLYEGDCLPILPTLPQADLVVTDPPYGRNYQSGRSNHSPIEGDQDASLAEAALRILKVKSNRHLYVFWSPKVVRPDAEALRIQGWTPLVWDKSMISMGGDHCWSLSHEEILFGVSVPSRSNRVKGQGQGAARLRRSSVLTQRRLNSRGSRRHPTEKPVPLLRDLIEASSRAGEVVIDPFAGVGSTLVAAILEGRKAVGIEIDPNYVAIAVERIKRAEEIVQLMVGI